jgi:LPS-assembly lipoprotein
MGSGRQGSYELQLEVGDETSTVITYPQPRTNRKAVELSVGYKLYGTDRRKPLTGGNVKSRVSYDITDQPFADRQADVDATERAAIEAAGEIRTRLAVYFSRR